LEQKTHIKHQKFSIGFVKEPLPLTKSKEKKKLKWVYHKSVATAIQNYKSNRLSEINSGRRFIFGFLFSFTKPIFVPLLIYRFVIHSFLFKNKEKMGELRIHKTIL